MINSESTMENNIDVNFACMLDLEKFTRRSIKRMLVSGREMSDITQLVR